ncbi:hypothetical protein D3C81_345290 [compost metagenome]
MNVNNTLANIRGIKPFRTCEGFRGKLDRSSNYKQRKNKTVKLLHMKNSFR